MTIDDRGRAFDQHDDGQCITWQQVQLPHAAAKAAGIDADRVVEVNIKFQNKDSLLFCLRFWI
jgi:hypothetical protein